MQEFLTSMFRHSKFTKTENGSHHFFPTLAISGFGIGLIKGTDYFIKTETVC